MLLESLEAENFRNLNGQIVCGKNLNIIFGENGQGKTNWLEAIYLLATTKSFKTARLQEAIKFEEELAIVRGNVHQGEHIDRLIQVALQGNTKTLTVNGKKEPLTRFLGELHAIIFNSDELEIVRGTPEARRKFLDGGIVSIYPPFVQTLTDYNRVIRQKNSLLQSARENEFSIEKVSELLEPWNEQLINLATRIHKARLRFVERLNEVLEKKFFGKEEITIRYVSSLEDKGDLSDYAALLEERLKLRVQAELVSGHALLGTHRDDLDILFDGHDLRKFGTLRTTAKRAAGSPARQSFGLSSAKSGISALSARRYRRRTRLQTHRSAARISGGQNADFRDHFEREFYRKISK